MLHTWYQRRRRRRQLRRNVSLAAVEVRKTLCNLWQQTGARDTLALALARARARAHNSLPCRLVTFSLARRHRRRRRRRRLLV